MPKINYWERTPKWARKLGDGLLGASLSITTFAVANNDKTMAIIALWFGVGGKFLTNMFAHDDTGKQNDKQ